MSVLPQGGRLLDGPQALPPKEQRIIAPGDVRVIPAGMGAPQCPCSLAVIDQINLIVYYLPMTPQMVTRLIDALDEYDPRIAETDNTENNHR